MPKYETRISVSGPDGNVFVIIGKVHRLLSQLESKATADDFRQKAMSAPSYSAVLELVREWFPCA
jgi:hypothetical protein